jgi:DNA-binding transcriptional ArsR family regulator
MNEKSERDPGSGRATAHRAIRDVPSLQALAHPTRLALLEAIGLAGAMTATQASAVVGESPTACAYHLRMLARLGFIEEAGGGKGRERPWRLVPVGFAIGEDQDDPATAQASGALEKVLLERFFSNIRHFELERSRYPQEVRDLTGTVQSIAFATPEEMARLREELIALLSRYVDRLDPALRPADGYPFEVIVFTHVLPIPGLPPGATDAQPPPYP